jgi:hypothetical protein
MGTGRCVLYVFRCAVYFATEKVHDEELLKWWNWQDKFLSGNGVRLSERFSLPSNQR